MEAEQLPAPAADRRSATEAAYAALLAQQTEEGTSAFECNVCLELSKEPVVTLCGHLYCWPCLYRWTQGQCCARGVPPVCPVCKAGVDVEKVIPIYGRGSDFDHREKLEPLPPRPAGQRPVHVAPPEAQARSRERLMESLSTLFGFNLGNSVYELTPEQRHQVSRLPCVHACMHACMHQILFLAACVWASMPAFGHPCLRRTKARACLSHNWRWRAACMAGGQVHMTCSQSGSATPMTDWFYGSQAFSSRLLLLLGSFVIICLLLY